MFSRSVRIQRYKPQVRASSREHFTALNGKRTHTAKMSQVRSFSGVDLDAPFPAPAPCRLLQPMSPAARSKHADSGGQVVPPPCATPHSVQWRAAGVPWRRPRKGSSGNGSVKVRSVKVNSNVRTSTALFHLMEHHPRSPGGLAGAARLRVAAPEPPT